MAMIEMFSSPYATTGVYEIVALVALPLCLAGILIAEQALIRFDPDAHLYKIHWALMAGGFAGTVVCLPFVLYGGAEPTLGPVFGSMSGLAYWLLSERRLGPSRVPSEG